MESRKENVSSKGTSLTSSFLYKCLTLALTLFVVLGTPIREVKADTYDYEFENKYLELWQIGAYRYFVQNGYQVTSDRTYTMTVSEMLSFGDVSLDASIDPNTPVVIRVPSHYLTGSSVQSSTSRPNMFCSYIDYNLGTGGTQGDMFNCRLTESAYNETVTLDGLSFEISDFEGTFTSSLNAHMYTYLDFGEMSGTYTGYTAYDSNSASTFSVGDNDLYFLIRPNVLSIANANVSFYPQANSVANVSTSVSNLGYYSGLTLFRIRVTTDATVTGNLSIGRLVGRSENVIPIYFGRYDSMPDVVYEFLYGNRYVPILRQIDNHVYDIYNYLEGGSSAQSSADSVVSSASSTDTATNQLHSFEETQITQFNTSLQSVPTSSSLLTTDGFLNGASYVRDMFDTVAVGQFRGLLSFTLIIGFALLMIGKVR